MVERDPVTEVVLLSLPGTRRSHASFSLGLAYLVATLRRKHITAEQLSFPSEIDTRTLAEQILLKRPRLVGFSLLDCNYHVSRLVARSIKDRAPNVAVVAGGPTATMVPNMVLEPGSPFDLAVRGEGEEALDELLGRIIRCQEIDGIPGILNAESLIKEGTLPPPAVIENLDSLASPFHFGSFSVEGEIVRYSSQRGCRGSCIFCCVPTLSNRRVRAHSVDRVISDLEVLARAPYPPKMVSFSDPDFCARGEGLEEFCEVLARAGLPFLFVCQARPESLNKNVLFSLRRAGVIRIGVGVETFSGTLRRSLDKNLGMTDTDLQNHLRFCAEAANQVGIELHINVIVGLDRNSDTPIEEFNAFKDIKGARCNLNHLAVFAGTPLTKRLDPLGDAIGPSIFTLPLRSTYGNVEGKISHFGQTTHDSRTAQEHRLFMESLEGGRNDTVLHSSRCLLVIENGDSLDSKFVKNLAEDIPVNSRIAIGALNNSDHRLSHILTKLVQSGAPTIDYVAFYRTTYGCYSDFEVNFRPIADLSDYDRHPPLMYREVHINYIPSANPFNGYWIIYGSVKELAELVEAWTRQEKWFLSEASGAIRRDAGRFHITDGCRWGRRCVVTEHGFLRCIVDSSGRCSFCWSEKSISNQRERPSIVWHRFLEVRRSVMLRRGCESCSVTDICSKCIEIPTSLETQYCSLRRRFGDIQSRLINWFTVAGIVERFILDKRHTPSVVQQLMLRLAALTSENRISLRDLGFGLGSKEDLAEFHRFLSYEGGEHSNLTAEIVKSLPLIVRPDPW